MNISMISNECTVFKNEGKRQVIHTQTLSERERQTRVKQQQSGLYTIHICASMNDCVRMNVVNVAARYVYTIQQSNIAANAALLLALPCHENPILKSLCQRTTVKTKLQRNGPHYRISKSYSEGLCIQFSCNVIARHVRCYKFEYTHFSTCRCVFAC